MAGETKMLSMSQANLLGFIAASGSKQIDPEGGGYWSVDGKRSSEGTHTVYALERRGLLRKIGTGHPWRSSYQLTDDARLLVRDAGLQWGA